MRKRIDSWISGFLLLLVATLSVLPLRGESQGGYIVSYLNLNTGMPANYVDDIYRDSRGFIWISTHGSGLLRYDGYSYMNFGLSGPFELSMCSNGCLNVVEDRQGRLWVAFEEGTRCLDVVHGRTLLPKATSKQTEKVLKRIAATPCMRVYCDTKGNIWILTVSELCRISFDAEGNISEALVAPHHTKVPDLAMADFDNDGSVYVGLGLHLNKVYAQRGRLVVKNLSARYPQLNGLIVSAMVKWNGRLWFGTNHGLYNNTPGDRGLHYSATGQGLQHETVTSLTTSSNQDYLIIGTLGGVDLLDRNRTFSEHWNSNSVPNALSGDFVNCIYSFGQQLWIGTENGGITQFRPRFLDITNFLHDPAVPGSLSQGAVNAMYESPAGDLWIGTVEGGLNLLQRGSHDFVHFTTSNSRLPHNSVSVLQPDGAGNVWIGTWGGGVAVSSKGSIHPLVTDARHAADLMFIGAMAYDPYNRGMWIGANAGLFFYDFKTHQLRDPFPQCRTINGAIGSLVTRDGKLFMGCLPGMVVVDLKKGPNRSGQFAFTHYIYKLDNPSSRAYEKVTSFFQTHDGTIWIGSNGDGIYRLKGSRPDSASVKCFTISDGLANNGVKGLAEDNRGLLWIATDNGLSCLNPRTETFDNFTMADGLLSNQFYFNGIVKGDHGKIWLGSDKGLTLLRGSNRFVEPRMKLTFTALYVNNRYVKAGSDYLKEDIALCKEVHLHESDRSFVIEFSSLSYDGNSRCAFAYRMKGYEDDWIPLPVGEHSVRYSMLPAGHYTFEVRSTPSMGGGKEQIASVDVTVAPYFWKSWWFVSLLFLTFAFLAFMAYKHRMRLMRDRVVERLYRPIESALKDSKEPELLQSRIEKILQNERLYQISQQQSIDKDKTEVKSNEVPFMDRIMKVMEENYSNPDLNVMMIAEAMGMQRTEVSKQLQSNVGVTTSQFIRNYRLDLAKKMLEENVADRNITEIAFRVGFNDPKYFTRCFSQRFGVAPSAYKKS